MDEESVMTDQDILAFTKCGDLALNSLSYKYATPKYATPKYATPKYATYKYATPKYQRDEIGGG